MNISRQLFVLVALTGVVSPAGVMAQAGDRAGEVQTPPPAHLKSPPSPALSPADAMRTFRLPPGFRVELVAAEPLVFDPVAMSFGADGRLWVVEMRAFMPNADGQGEDAPIGSIAVLTDSDGDGRMDRRSEFAGGLVMPRAVAPVANGALVAEPPNLWFFEDKDGDGKADSRTLVANDYGDRSNPEHTANGLLWAMDNWIYSANHTVRFRYDAGQWRREPTMFRGQWGITQDDVGRLYYNSNSDPLRMDVLPAESLRRNPNLVAPAGVNVQLAPPRATPVWPARLTLGVNRGYRVLRDDGTLPEVTAACGPVIYRGTTFPRSFHGNAFIAEPSANLVKRLIVDAGATPPSARNAYARAEFLASTDERFRPVNLYNGPDGALYVVDMYRGIIQHRIYLTTYLRNQIRERGLEAPVGLGRIWRIVPEGAPRFVKPDLAKARTAQLVATLEHPEAWWRDTAQRLLVERRDAAAFEPLRRLVRESRMPLGRLHALWTLEGVDAADWKSLEIALRDVDVNVAVAAARIAERHFADDPRRVADALASRAAWGEPAFLRQMALTLAVAPPDIADATYEKLAIEHGELRYLADAIVSGAAGRELALLDRIVAAGKREATPVIASLAAAILQSKDADGMKKLLAHLDETASRPWLAESILDGVDRFIPGSGDRRRTMFLSAEPTALLEFARRETPLAARARESLRYLRWRGAPVDAATALASLSDAERARFERGREAFAVCAACHQANGEGAAGVAPALVGSPWVTGGVGALARIVLNGKTSGETTMPPLATLDDDTIAAILTYIRKSWGHDAPAVSPGEIRAVRTEVANREEPWTEAQLEPMN